MKRLIIVASIAATFGATPVLAQVCSSGTNITGAQLSSLLNNRYACIGSSPNATWNELHTAGKVLDYKLGPSHATDPSATASNPTGTYATAGSGGPQGPGTVTYNYGSGGTYAYNVRANLTGTIPWSGTGTYSFCGTGGASNFAVTISATNC